MQTRGLTVTGAHNFEDLFDVAAAQSCLLICFRQLQILGYNSTRCSSGLPMKTGSCPSERELRNAIWSAASCQMSGNMS